VLEDSDINLTTIKLTPEKKIVSESLEKKILINFKLKSL